MKRMKSTISAGMTRSFQIAITTSLILIVTISLVTNQVLAVEVVNTNSTNQINSATSTIQLNDNPTFKSKVQDRIGKFLQYKNSKTDSKFSNLKLFLQSAVEERKAYIQDNFKTRIDKLDKISDVDKQELQNYIANVVAKLETDSANIEKGTSQTDLVEVKNEIYNNSKTFLVEGPKIHFKIERAKLNFYKSKTESVQTELANKILVLQTNGSDASTLIDMKTKLDNQILSLKNDIANVDQKISGITTNLDAEQLRIAKDNARDSLTKAYDTIKIIKSTLNEIATTLK